MSKNKSLVSYDSEYEETDQQCRPALKRPKASIIAKKLLITNQSTQTYEDFIDACQNCTTFVKNEIYGINAQQKFNESNDRLTAAEKLAKKLREDVFDYGKIIIKLKSDKNELQKKVKALEEENTKVSSEAENERIKSLKIFGRLNKLEKDAEEMMEKEKELKRMKEEMEAFKKMAEKYIAKADEEKEAESQRADEAEAKIEELQIRNSLFSTANELQKSEIIRLQAAYETTLRANTDNNDEDTTKQFVDAKSRRRIQREAKRLFGTWKINYEKNKNKEMEFQNDQLKKRLKECEAEKEREIRKVINKNQKINDLENERLNLQSTIKKQKVGTFLLGKQLESEATTKSNNPESEQHGKKMVNSQPINDGTCQLMKELNSFKANESIQHNNLVNADLCSATVTFFGPKWKVSKKLCGEIWKRCHNHIKIFLEEYVDQLFTFSEQLLPEKVLENSGKWLEVKAVIHHFFESEHEKDEEDETELKLDALKEVMAGKRYRARQRMYRNCSSFQLCAVTSNDKMFYYVKDQSNEGFYVPYEDQECQKYLECKVFQNSILKYSIPKQYESCPFIVIIKDDDESQQVIIMDCATGSTKIVWERKKNI